MAVRDSHFKGDRKGGGLIVAKLDHRNSGVRIRDDGTTINIADKIANMDASLTTIKNSLGSGSALSSGSVVGKVSVTTTATPLRVGGADLVGRTEIILANDSSFLLFVGFDSGVSGTSGIILNSGTTISFALDPNDPFTLFGKAIEMPASITVIEIK